MNEPTTTPLAAGQLEALFDLSRKLLSIRDYDELLTALVRDSLDILGGERGFLVLQKGDGLDLRVVRNWSREEIEGGDAVSSSIVRDVLEGGEPLLIEDAMAEPRFADSKSVLRMGIRSVLAAPLTVDGAVAGALYLESRRNANLFGAKQLALFRRILELGTPALEAATRRILLEERTHQLEHDLMARYRFPGIVGRDPAFLEVLETVGQVASSELPILVQGPSGTGKELVVKAIHLNSRRSAGPLVTVNCGAISPQLLESELFGHVKGAFTGATGDKRGLIPSADGGTVFLDEVGELPQDLQVKLLRTLQFGEVQPVGSVRPRRVDARFVAATNRVLADEVESGRFREDLLYRLNAITLDLPPLAERPGDVLPLYYHFLERAARAEGRETPQVTPRLERALQAYDWPGNVRELENEALRGLAITPGGAPLTIDSLSPRVARAAGGGSGGASGGAAASDATGNGDGDAPGTLVDQEKELIELHLRHTGGNRTQAAKNLGISREGLRKKMKRYGLD